ncbi:hypothetical protein BDR26DRAFT_854085 [Obelidium mucronatum]|nr:hypothetical protein BDR26DRAFT_854085 [Obelidium mucronatum]
MFADQFDAECATLGVNENSVETVKNALKAKEKNKLVLKGHCIDAKALTALCSVLSKDVLISSLCLSDAFLGDDGAILLSGCLKKNGTIAHLDLRGNNIRSDGAIAIAQMLKMNNSLKSLMLEWNCLGIWETGIKAIADAISVNDGLEVLDLRNCKLSPQGVNMLSLGLKQNKALKSLDLRWNSGGLIPEDLLRAIESCIERNKSRHEESMKSKLNADFLSSTFQQLAQSHQNTIESLSTKLELSKENTGEVAGKLAGREKRMLIWENIVSGLQKEILDEKEKAAINEERTAKATTQLQMKLKDLEIITKDMDIQISVLKKDKSFLVDELDKVKRREKERMDFNQEKIDRLEHAQHKKIQELEADKDREFLEKARVFEDRIRVVENAKVKMADELDRAKSEFMAEKHKLLDLVSDTEIKIRNDEVRNILELVWLRISYTVCVDEAAARVGTRACFFALQSEHQVTSNENGVSHKTIRMQNEKIHDLEVKLDQCHEEVAHLKRSRAKEREQHESALKEKDDIIAKLRDELRRREEEMEQEREDQELRMKEISLQITSVLAQRKKSGKHSPSK